MAMPNLHSVWTYHGDRSFIAVVEDSSGRRLVEIEVKVLDAPDQPEIHHKRAWRYINGTEWFMEWPKEFVGLSSTTSDLAIEKSDWAQRVAEGRV